MTPMGRVQRLDDHTEAIYLYGREGNLGRTPGWYVRAKVDGGIGPMLGGPFTDADEAARWRDSSSRPRNSTPSIGTDTTASPDSRRGSPVVATFEATWLRAILDHHMPVAPSDAAGWIVDPNEYPWWFHPMLLVHGAHLYADPTSRVDAFVKLEGGEGMIIGAHVHLASFTHAIGGGRTLLENGASCSSGVKLVSGTALPGGGRSCSAVDPSVQNVRSWVWMKRNSTVYAGGIMLPESVLGEGSVLAAGSVLRARTVTGDHELWAGCPAVFKRRLT